MSANGPTGATGPQRTPYDQRAKLRYDALVYSFQHAEPGSAERIQFGEQLLEAGASPEDIERIAAEAEESLDAAAVGVYDPAGILARSSAGGPRYLTGIETLDERLTLRAQPASRGTPLKKIICIQGAPSAGKSMALGQMTTSLASQGLRIVLLIVDEDRETAMERIGQQLGFAHAELNSEYPKTVAAFKRECERRGFDITVLPDDQASETIETIEDAAKILFSVENDKGYVLGYDSLHGIESSTENGHEEARIQIKKRTMALRKLRREHRNLLQIFTAEVARGSYASKDESKRTSALAGGAESRDIEYASDAVVQLSCEGESDIVNAEIPKNKIGRKYAPFPLRRHDGSATLGPVKDEEVQAEKKSRREESLLPVEDAIVTYLIDEKDWRSTYKISRSLSAERLATRAAVEAALPAMFKKEKINRRDHVGKGNSEGFDYRMDVSGAPRPEQARLGLEDPAA